MNSHMQKIIIFVDFLTGQKREIKSIAIPTTLEN